MGLAIGNQVMTTNQNLKHKFSQKTSAKLKRFKTCVVYLEVRTFWIYTTIVSLKNILLSFHIYIKNTQYSYKKKKIQDF